MKEFVSGNEANDAKAKSDHNCCYQPDASDPGHSERVIASAVFVNIPHYLPAPVTRKGR